MVKNMGITVQFRTVYALPPQDAIHGTAVDIGHGGEFDNRYLFLPQNFANKIPYMHH